MANETEYIFSLSENHVYTLWWTIRSCLVLTFWLDCVIFTTEFLEFFTYSSY